MKKIILLLVLGVLFGTIALVSFALFTQQKNTSSVEKDQQGKIISYKDAAAFDKQTKTVEMPAAYVFNNRKYLFISSRSNPHHAHMVEDGGDKTGFFTVRIYLENLAKFPPGFEQTIPDKTLLVTGQIGWYQGDPHIVVTEPSQITIKK